MAGPLGVLSVGLVAATTGVGDVDGAPLGVLAAGPIAATTEVEDVDGGPPSVHGDMKCILQKRCW
jgi:hypothetical protein